ncbi:hypothetical protein V5P93_000339 [Actinokineospora auranticolor]|uniref:Choice-of-anchor G family protein n=1 Tax=Actinokineospora auranticolor TaxID=155976 RepID=A0A2S6GKR0_9PSEU|nr:hypothetical protein [Actinokineospora auranticolor]PPK65773.1 hypothetical protein CLV40_11233 [Actinokineospora auranticolor]
MRRRLVALPVTVVVGVLVAGPAAAQVPTTPVPPPRNPGAPPASAPAQVQPLGRAIGDAGTGLAVVRLLPNSAPTKSIIPGAADKLPRQSAVEVGFGLASAQANSEAYLAFERSIAQSSPGGIALQGASPQTPGALAQTAPPNNAQPRSGGVNPPSTPLNTLVKVGALNGRVQAQWSDTLGPCVDTIADSSTELASLSALNAIPTLPSTRDLTGVFDAPNLDPAADQSIIDGLKSLTGGLNTLGGVLGGAGSNTGSLLSLPNTMAARSVVKLVDIPGSKNKAVQSTSTLQVSSVKLLGGTPFEISVNVVSQPTLVVTSTGDKATSTVQYTAPVVDVVQGGKSLGRLDAANPRLDIPIGVPLPTGAALPGLEKLPVIGNLLANGQGVQDALGNGLKKLDLGVLRLSVAGLNQKTEESTQPFKGYQLGATARLLDLQVLPTDALGLPNLPSALAQVSLGEQVARAFAPAGGVVCGTGTAAPAAPPAATPQNRGPALAYTNAAYQSVPIFWAGTAMLLLGVVIVAALPRRPRTVSPRRAG